MPSQTPAYREDKTGSPKKQTNPLKESDTQTPQQIHPATLQQANFDPAALTPGDMAHLQRAIGNQALGNLLSGNVQRQAVGDHHNQHNLPERLQAQPAKYTPQVTPSSSSTIQRKLSTEEKSDKLRVLKDYVQFTPPQHFPDNFGSPPKDKLAYQLKLLAKIRSTQNAAYSLKAKGDMRADEEDDTWDDNSYNDKTLASAIDAIYDDGLKPKDSSRKIGRTDAEFNKHDCVWAAITYALGFPDSLSVEKKLAAAFSSQEGEVEDSILYRIMEELGWNFQGQGSFARMFPQPPGIGTASVANVKGYYDGRYIISEDKNAGGTQGHVLAVDVLDVDDPTVDGLRFRRQITLTDRQYHRQSRVDRTNIPQFAVYVWRVQGDNSGLADKIR
ncbi:MAG: hypothetical protein H6665_00300 [Ardenticatenaceae bacterium]|nr:hypothetical protein [Ardenticatenaceae bacterium]